ATVYPHIQQIHTEKVVSVVKNSTGFYVTTTENVYETNVVVIAINSSNPMSIAGLENYVIPHQKSLPQKNRIQLKNNDHLVDINMYVSGTLAAHRTQLANAARSGAAAATDVLTLWNNGVATHAHDRLRKK